MHNLKTELTVEKHFWLDEQQIQYFKNIAEHDPQEALKKWQYVSEDMSFKPFTKEEQHLKDLHDKQRDMDVEKFERLCEQHRKTSLDNDLSQTRTIEQSLNELVDQYKNDPVFLKTLEDSNNKNVQRIAENFKDDPEIEQKDLYRGFER